MNVSKTKVLGPIVAAGLLAGSLAACSSTGDLASSSKTTPPASSAAATTTPPPESPTAQAPTTPPAAAKQELAVVESAYGKVRDHWWYVVIVDNPNPDYVFNNAGLTFEAQDSAGTILDSDDEYTTLLSGKTAFTGTFYDVGDNEIANINARGPVASDADHAAADSTGSFTITDVKAKNTSYSTDVSGIVSSTFAAEQSLVKVVVVARSAAGKIIGGEFTFVERLPVGGKVQFSTSFLDGKLPAGTTYEAYASL